MDIKAQVGDPASAALSMTSALHKQNMKRAASWWQIVFIALGACALVMFSLGGISAVTGTISPFVWMTSASIGLIAAFAYAEMAAMMPNKSGGTANYGATAWIRHRSEEHTSELQSLMRISYAVFCLKKKK